MRLLRMVCRFWTCDFCDGENDDCFWACPGCGYDRDFKRVVPYEE